MRRPAVIPAAVAATLALAAGLSAATDPAETAAPAPEAPAAVVEPAVPAPEAAAEALGVLAPCEATTEPAEAVSEPLEAAAKPVAEVPAGPPAPPAERVLPVDYAPQRTYYTCGPAATRNALTAMGVDATEVELADDLGTTTAGTDSVHLVADVLTERTDRTYEAIMSPDADELRAAVVESVADGAALVANVAGAARTADGRRLDYGGGHYIALDGYTAHGERIHVADSARPEVADYWISLGELTDWVAARGIAKVNS